MSTRLPRPQAALVDQHGKVSHDWYSYLRELVSSDALEELSAQVAALAASAGTEAGAATFLASGSVDVLGTLASGKVIFRLKNDTQEPPPTYYYGTGQDGVKGFVPVSDALAAVVGETSKAVDAEGVAAIGLANLADSGIATLLVRTAFDAKGRRTGTQAATTTDLTEGTNLYHTGQRVRDTPLTGLSLATGTPITAADTMLTAPGKLQKQITDLVVDSIADADTTHAPSRNAVSGALAAVPHGLSNRIINGSFSINQRGFAGGALAAAVYGHDRWKAGTGGCSYSVSGDVVTHTSGPLVQIIESPSLASQTVFVSVEDPSGSVGVNVDGITGTITAGTGRRGVSIAVPSGSTGNVTLTLTATAVTYKRVQLERNSVSSAFEWRHPIVELALCQRYFETSFSPTVTPASGLGALHIFCTAFATNISRSVVAFKVTKRVSPSMTLYAPSDGGTGSLWAYYDGAWVATSSSGTPIVNQYGFNVDGVGAFSLNASYLFSGNWSADAEI